MQVRDLLNLKRPLQRSRELGATSQQKQGVLSLERALAQLLDRLVELEDLADLGGDVSKTLHDLRASSSLGCAVLGEGESNHDHGDELRGISLGGRNADFWAGVDVDTAVSEEGDRRTDNVDDTNSQSTALKTVAEGHQRISSLTGLGGENTGIVAENRRLAIEEIRGQLDGDWDIGEFLKDTTDGHARVVRGTAGNKNDAAAAADSSNVLAQTTKSDHLVLDIETTTHGVDDRLRLLENLLLHEMVKLALHDLLELQLEGLDGTDVWRAVVLGEAMDVEGSVVDVGDIVVLEVEHLLGVLDDGGWVGGEEELDWHWDAVVGHEGARLGAAEEVLVDGGRGEEVADCALLEGDVLGGLLGWKWGVVGGVLDIDEINLHLLVGLDSNDERRTLAGCDHLLWVVGGHHQETESALQLLDNQLGQIWEADVLVLVADVLGQLWNNLSIGLGLKLEALALK